MSHKKRGKQDSHNSKTLILITAILNLIAALINLIDRLLE